MAWRYEQPLGGAGGGGGGGAVTTVERTNDNASTVVIGQPVYTKANGNVDEAQADAAATTKVTGLVSDESIASAAAGDIIVDGILTATTTQWDAVTGKVGGLSINSIYYLDPNTVGQLTDTAPTTTGDYVAPIGLALSTTELCIRITPTVLL
jgi:hypothetical protein